MAEVLTLLSAIQATTQLLEQAFRVLGRLQKAHQRQKGLLEVLNRHETELKSVKTIIGILDDEEELHTATVTEEILRLQDVQSKLSKLLDDLDPKPKSKVVQFARQLTQGSSDEKKLCSLMNELGHVKTALLIRIEVANVGVMKGVQKQLVANAEVIQRIDTFLREEFGDFSGLRIARLLKGRRPSNDGTVPLTAADLKLLSDNDGRNADCAIDDSASEDQTLVDDSETRKDPTQPMIERIILRNIARHQAIQINAALGEDVWKDVDRLVVKDNVAEDQSVQINYGMTIATCQWLFEQRKGITTPAPQCATEYRRELRGGRN
ncbi:hypothetical protein BU24DRAFT_435314 [Aaosphaeria arxii CBS 175.79]|uniref:Fungal N-terminal domain-containing protein n=1 Tax=Aaosphaeria arxii CBS 175.79 TaxID=1450172 RepID=A0A6A5XJN8_9PLEO|nr:uncharacterized protein BU24DRAFT_435314 [Aaosphaeria arxii CBS 175.79]KAF2013027.1 hypothetical protein BU24DRAFT_435314 [Aaosphaeria arxii CBS 175.79]